MSINIGISKNSLLSNDGILCRLSARKLEPQVLTLYFLKIKTEQKSMKYLEYNIFDAKLLN